MTLRGLSVLVLGSLIFSVSPGQSAIATPGWSWGGTTTLTEGDAASPINSASITNDLVGVSFDSGYVEFSIASPGGTDNFTLETVGSASTSSGSVSVVGGSVYLGNGSTADNIGSIDDTRDGESGQPLRVNFVNSFPNASFEADANGATNVTGWTEYPNRIILGESGGDVGTVIEGYPAVDTRSYEGNCRDNKNDGVFPTNSFGTAEFSVTVSNTDPGIVDGDNALRLYFRGVRSGSQGWVVHGPAAASSEFQASQGDVISFDWRSEQASDSSVAFGYLLKTDAPNQGAQFEILERVSASSTAWATEDYTIQDSGTYKFVFVSGGDNRDCLSAATATLWIDNVQVVGNKATESVAEKVAQLVRYSNSSDAPPASRVVTLTTLDGSGTQRTAQSTVNITPVNDAPSIDGDGDTTAVAKTVTETDASSEDNPLADVTGTLVGFDPDLDSPTFTFGITGGTVSGSEVSKVGTYGTLTVNSSTGAYTYVPNMAAIKPLDTGDDPVDSFALTVSDGSLSGTGTLNFTIDSLTDTEPTAPSIAEVIPGDGFLSVLFDAPGSEGGNAITGYEYSTDGTNFEAVSSLPVSGFSITTLSSDGTTPLENGTPYSITIRADNGQLSPVSNAVSGTPGDSPTVSRPTIQSFEPSASLTEIDDDFTVSGFDASDNLLVTIGLEGQSSGTQFALPNFEDSDATEGSGYSSYTDGTAVTEFAMTGDQTEVNAALRGLQLKTGSNRSNFALKVSASVVSGSIIQSGTTQSFYQYVPASAITWDDAKEAAEDLTFAGVSGYLVTITSEAENLFVKDRIIDNGVAATNVWIGASDGSEEGIWRWVTGPEGANGGTIFWTEDDGAITYDSWSSGEPDNAGGNQHVAVTNWNSATGAWNDLRADNSGSINGYVVEYSEWNGQTFSEDSVVSTSSSVSMGGAVLSGTARVQSAALSWDAPTRSGQTVTSYAVTSVPSVAGLSACSGTATTCTVRGLTAGTAYTFTVTATWSDSATSVSNAVAVRALAVPPAPTVSGGGETITTPATPAPIPTVTPRVVPRLPATPPIQAGPVLRGNVPPAPPSAPTATIGGRSTPIQTQMTSPTGFSLTAGVLNLGLQVQEDQGVVRQNNNGGTEVEVRKGSTTALTGSGLLPRSTVQVFLPLQGSNAKEVARIPVDETGSFSGDAVFATRANERPMPIGRQVMQIVSLDENGQQSVVEMTVNIAQSAPAPEPDRTAGVTPTLRPGQFLATNAGEPEIVTVVPVPEDRQARVEGDGWQMAVDIPSANGSVAPSDEGGALLQLVRDETAVVSGSGFMPGTRADVWLFSEPTLLGTVDIDENGEFTGEVNIDSNVVVVGEHTLQLQGVGEDGYVRAANLGVVVNDTAAEVPTEEAAGGLLWWLVGLIAVIGLAAALTIWQVRSRRV